MLSIWYRSCTMLSDKTAHEERTAALIFVLVQLEGKLTAAGERLVGPIGLTPARWKVLGTIRNAPMTMAEIGRALGNARQSVRRLVGELADAGLVQSVENPRSKKAALVDITAAGLELYNKADAVRIPWNRNLASRLDREDVITALKLVGELSTILSSFD